VQYLISPRGKRALVAGKLNIAVDGNRDWGKKKNQDLKKTYRYNTSRFQGGKNQSSTRKVGGLTKKERALELSIYDPEKKGGRGLLTARVLRKDLCDKSEEGGGGIVRHLQKLDAPPLR